MLQQGMNLIRNPIQILYNHVEKKLIRFFNSKERAAAREGCKPATVKCIKSMIQSRQILAKVGEAVAYVRALRGCSQVEVLLSLLWSMVLVDLLTRLIINGFQTLGYADDLVV